MTPVRHSFAVGQSPIERQLALAAVLQTPGFDGDIGCRYHGAMLLEAVSMLGIACTAWRSRFPQVPLSVEVMAWLARLAAELPVLLDVLTERSLEQVDRSRLMFTVRVDGATAPVLGRDLDQLFRWLQRDAPFRPELVQ